MYHKLGLIVWLLVAVCASCLPSQHKSVPSHPADVKLAGLGEASNTSKTVPSIDPFYKPTSNYADTAPGTVLRIRKASSKVTNMVTAAAGYNILYRTTDSRGKSSFAMTTVLLPSTNSPSKLLSFQIPYDTVDVDASPSYALRSGEASIKAALASGWVVNSPDYEGPHASFTAGHQSGQATLDSVRAVLNAATKMGLSTGMKYAMWGYSGGALASEWAAELQPTYAPELSFSGAALGGLTPNVSTVMSAVEGTMMAALTPAGILGLVSQYPEYLPKLTSMLKTTGPHNKTGFMQAYKHNLLGSLPLFATQNIAEYFVDGAAVFQMPWIKEVVHKDGVMGLTGTPKMPIFVYKAIGDQVSLVSETDALVKKLCSQGANIVEHRNKVGEHLSEEHNGVSRAMDFLERVVAGKWQHTGCTVRDVSVVGNSAKVVEF